MNKPNNDFAKLCDAVEKRKLIVVLPLYRRSGKNAYRIEIRSPDDKKVMEYEDVRQTESIETAAKRMHARLRRQRVVEA